MSHYNVNAGVPKTLIQHLIRWVIDARPVRGGDQRAPARDRRAGDHPRADPAREDQRPQSTEESVGPYSLQDFTLFHVIRRGYRPSKIAFLAWHAWRDAAAGEWPPGFPESRRTAYDLPTIRRWLEVFVRRFFASQFKRSALPNGPKVSAGGTMSPRGDWRMPSDAGADRLAGRDRGQRPAVLSRRRPLRGSHGPRILLERDGSARVLGALPCAVPPSRSRPPHSSCPWSR